MKVRNNVVPKNVLALAKQMGWFDKEKRDEAIDKLYNYLNQDAPLPAIALRYKSLTVIWKGFYDAMLQQGDPLLQEELAEKISNFVHIFKKDKTVNSFVQVAFETFAREWDKVNQFMVDKMLMFFRRVFRQGLFCLADRRWRHCEKFVKMLEETVIRPLDHDNEFGIAPKMHLCCIYMEELAKSNNEHLTHDVLMVFLRPYIQVLSVSRQQHYVSQVRNNIFHYLLRQGDLGVDSKSDMLMNEMEVKPRRSSEDEDDSEEDEDCEEEGSDDTENLEDEDDEEEQEEYPLDPRAGDVNVILPQLEVDYEALRDTLLKLLEDSAVRYVNKVKIRQLVKQFMDYTGGVYPLATHSSLLPRHEQLQQELPEVNVNQAVEKRLALLETEFRAIPKVKKGGQMTLDDLEAECNAADRAKKILGQERALKWKTYEMKKKKFEQQKEKRRFDKYAKRTSKMNAKLETRRLKAKGGKILTSEEKMKLIHEKRLLKEAAVMNSVNEVISAFTGAAEKKPVKGKIPAEVVSKALPLPVASVEVGKSAAKTTESPASPARAAAISKKQSDTNAVVFVKGLTHTDAAVSKKQPNADAAVSKKQPNTDAAVSKKRHNNDAAVDKNGLANTDATVGKKRLNTDTAAPCTPQSKKLRLARTPNSIKINLGENKHHDFHDYQRSILASPAIPYQPERTPKASALKVTTRPILVKTMLSRTLKSIPTTAPEAPVATDKNLRKKLKALKKKKGKVSPEVVKALQKNGMDVDDLNSKQKSSSKVTLVEKVAPSPKGSPVKPVAKKLPGKRAVAADFF